MGRRRRRRRRARRVADFFRATGTRHGRAPGPRWHGAEPGGRRGLRRGAQQGGSAWALAGPTSRRRPRRVRRRVVANLGDEVRRRRLALAPDDGEAAYMCSLRWYRRTSEDPPTTSSRAVRPRPSPRATYVSLGASTDRRAAMRLALVHGLALTRFRAREPATSTAATSPTWGETPANNFFDGTSDVRRDAASATGAPAPRATSTSGAPAATAAASPLRSSSRTTSGRAAHVAGGLDATAPLFRRRVLLGYFLRRRTSGRPAATLKRRRALRTGGRAYAPRPWLLALRASRRLPPTPSPMATHSSDLATYAANLASETADGGHVDRHAHGRANSGVVHGRRSSSPDPVPAGRTG